ncbi:Lrp/AsnC family transcriptional regulator [Piscinibacter sp.]|jgi:DNA-binding Lrp family transcriptional regulator|uniref:Lrp/AsnC family transcriptional regulator n=1 Tax=Piscinibacter sp. TaxID=1903157 RepID=UPI003559D321
MNSATLDPTDALLIRRLHGDFPLGDAPYAEVAQQLGLSESEVLARLQRLLDDGVLSRFGPLFQIERAGGQFVLAAMAVPEERFDAVAEQLNALSEVAHNYRREHALNMWFVVACASPAQARATCERIETMTGLRVFAFPKEKEYFVELRLPL